MKNGSSFPFRPASQRVFFCPHQSQLFLSGHRPCPAAGRLYLRRVRLLALRLRFTAAEIGTQGLAQPFGLNPLFVLGIFSQLRSPIHSDCPRTRCQIARKGASRLTTAPSLRIRPTFCVCCCSSVVERVIGNDEVGSSILPSSTRICLIFKHFSEREIMASDLSAQQLARISGTFEALLVQSAPCRRCA